MKVFRRLKIIIRFETRSYIVGKFELSNSIGRKSEYENGQEALETKSR